MAKIAKHLASLAPASRAKGRIPVGTMASGAEIAIPYILLKGAREGPCLWISGQVHGAEINGILAAMDFIGELSPAEVRGSVVVSPTANPPALDARFKYAPQDGQDLDQTFPGNAGALTSNRLSAALFDELRGCADLVVSMHTLPPIYDCNPYGVYKQHPDGKVGEAELLRLVSFFRPAVVCRMSVEPGQGELPGHIPGALDYQCLALGIPAFMIELGAGGREDRAHVRQGVEGFMGVAGHMGLVEPSVKAPTETLCRVTRRTHVTCGNGGLFRRLRGSGEPVRAGEALGRIVDLHGETVETVSLDRDLMIIGIRREPVVHTGDRVAFVALAWEEVSP
jgi:hypothetical protein